jgi:glutaredoxin-like protein
MPEPQIRMFGTRYCPDCARAKQVFNKHNIEYDWVDIEQDKDAVAFVQNVSKGFKSVPTIVFPDGSILIEPSNAELEEKIASLIK